MPNTDGTIINGLLMVFAFIPAHETELLSFLNLDTCFRYATSGKP